MSRPLCTRIEITYADGGSDIADGSIAEQILRFFELAQQALACSGTTYAAPPQFLYRSPDIEGPAVEVDSATLHFGVPE